MSLLATIRATIARRLAGRIVNPCPGYPVTTPYRVPGEWQAGYHTGEDHACPVGTPVVAVSWGHVVEVSSSGGSWGAPYGQLVVVEVGDRVRPGQVIGLSGATGNVTGPHLHFEARKPPFLYGNDVRTVNVKRRPR